MVAFWVGEGRIEDGFESWVYELQCIFCLFINIGCFSYNIFEDFVEKLESFILQRLAYVVKRFQRCVSNFMVIIIKQLKCNIYYNAS